MHARRRPAAIESATENALTVPEVIALAMETEARGADAVLVYCTADTPLHEARERVHVPVVDLMETILHLAAMLAHCLSVLSSLEIMVARFVQLARRHRLAGALCAVRDDNAHALALGCDGFAAVDEAIALDLSSRL